MKTLPFDFNAFKTAGETFFRGLVSELKTLGIHPEGLVSDHLCFRIGTLEEYGFYRHHLSQHGVLLTEFPVNGRPISTFLMAEPLHTETHSIRLIELPAPKPGTSYDSGFEHAEFIIDESFDQFAKKYPHLNLIEAGNTNINPELCLKLENKQAKFHHLSLERVIEIEKAAIKDIIFDFDGTLIRSRENIYEINRIVFSEALEREVSLQEAIDKFHPEFAKLFEAFEITCPQKRDHAISRWGAVSTQFPYNLFAGVAELLQKLKSLGFRLHLWTARDENSARKILNDHQIAPLFSTLSFATNIDSKPHANSLRFDWQSTQKNQIVVIGDSPADILGAKNINALRAGVLWDSYTKKDPLIAAGAELLFHEVSELESWLLNKVARRTGGCPL